MAPPGLARGSRETGTGAAGAHPPPLKYQRNSYIMFSIGEIVHLSAFLMTVQSLLVMADSGGPKTPAGLCAAHH